MIIRRKTPTVLVGKIPLGGTHPIVIQSMTNTPTADITKTVSQIKSLADSGSEIVRITINDDKAMCAVPKIIALLRKQGYRTPIVGDFHYNGHVLLSKYPVAAKLLDKYRINPGNVGRGAQGDENFSKIIGFAVKYQKPVRIGVNAGSLDQYLLKKISAQRSLPKRSAVHAAMVQSALQSARFAEKLGLPKNKIVLSVKMSAVQDMVTVYQSLAERCDHVLHLGLTESGAGRAGIIASTSALSILLAQGIGDTIRISLTPQKGHPRTEEVECSKELLQSLGLRYFKPSIISCPGCGRTASRHFEILAKDISAYVDQRSAVWKKKYPKVNALKVAVMGCVVNGPGESKNADIGISLPGRGETAKAVVYTDGRLAAICKTKNLKKEFTQLIERYIKTKSR